MRKPLFILFILLSLNAVAQNDLKLWYKQPARNWNEALPIGNGRLGAMVFGGVNEELLQLNESSLWSGGPVNTNPNPLAPQYLGELRKALAQEEYELAEELAKKMQGPFTESYEPLGDLKLKFNFNGEPTDYYRDLNISNATATTRFKINGVEYVRELFSSAPDQLIIIRLTASQPKSLNFLIETTSPLYHQKEMLNDHEIALRGRAPSHIDPNYMQSMEQAVIYNDATGCRGMRFEFRVKIKNTDGSVSTTESGIQVKDATEVILYLSAATSFNGFDKCPDKDGVDEKKLAENYLNKIESNSFDVLKKNHETDYHNYFDRVSLSINGNPKQEQPTDQRLRDYTKGKADVALEVLYFQFGRYLLISSSRPGGMPANLQGIWNHHVRPPWSSNYTTNINTEMNYWMAESCNLSELHTPLIDMIKRVATTGKETTRNFYNMNGWTMHHNTDIWATSNPMSGSPTWANWPMGGAWLAQHLWEHYSFTEDIDYLKTTAYP
ncbi:MAG TPA: glycoside hydrolase family 95 protein, partial [Cyclobacteriaceae bacterium]